MPTLTEDKKEEIWKSYHETKSFTETAKRLGIDPRTVAGVVKKKKAALAVKNLADSQADDPTKTSRLQKMNPERKMQQRAYALFDKGRSNREVSRVLKLSSSEVIQYRKEYNDMKKADLDQEIEQINERITRAEAILKQRGIELQEREDKLNILNSEIKSKQGIIAKLSSEVNRLTKSIDALKDSEKTAENRTQIARDKCSELERQRDIKREELLSTFVKQMEGLSDGYQFSIFRPFFDSNLFKRTMPEVMIHTVCNALVSDPNRATITNAIQNAEAGKFFILPRDALLNRDDMGRLVEFVKKNAPDTAEWVYRGKLLGR